MSSTLFYIAELPQQGRDGLPNWTGLQNSSRPGNLELRRSWPAVPANHRPGPQGHSWQGKGSRTGHAGRTYKLAYSLRRLSRAGEDPSRSQLRYEYGLRVLQD